MRRTAEEDLRYKYTLRYDMLSETARTSQVACCDLLLFWKTKRWDKSDLWRKKFTIAKINGMTRLQFRRLFLLLSEVSSQYSHARCCVQWGKYYATTFFKKGEIVTKEVFVRSDGCSEVVDGNYVVRKAICFSAGHAPVYTSHVIQNWLSDNVGIFKRRIWSKEFWPPNRPDLNPLNYYVWSVVERTTNKSRHPNVMKNCYWGSIHRHG